jgi:dimeric dUTPase (all-alpha-NTP-PPase superfamily)
MQKNILALSLILSISMVTVTSNQPVNRNVAIDTLKENNYCVTSFTSLHNLKTKDEAKNLYNERLALYKNICVDNIIKNKPNLLASAINDNNELALLVNCIILYSDMECLAQWVYNTEEFSSPVEEFITHNQFYGIQTYLNTTYKEKQAYNI